MPWKGLVCPKSFLLSTPAYMLCMSADMAVSSAGHAPPEVLAGTIGVLGRLGFQDEIVLDSLARHLMPGVQQLKPEHITELVSTVRIPFASACGKRLCCHMQCLQTQASSAFPLGSRNAVDPRATGPRAAAVTARQAGSAH